MYSICLYITLCYYIFIIMIVANVLRKPYEINKCGFLIEREKY